MESPLDVLSRAASMVETHDKNAQDPLYKGLPLLPPPPPQLDRSVLEPASVTDHIDTVDHRASPGKELPTKQQKHERLKERREMSHKSHDHSLHHSHRQPTNVTSQIHHHHSVSPVEHYRNGSSSPSETPYTLHHHQLLPSSLPSHPAHPPPRYPHPIPTHNIDLHTHHEGPLNLSITNNGNGKTTGNASSPASHSPTQSRPSVITCVAPPTNGGRYENGGSSGASSPARTEVSTDLCDPAIEEHFRRSLGKHYPEYLVKHPSVTPSPPPVTPPRVVTPATTVVTIQLPQPQLPITTTATPESNVSTNVSITGSVDDHFARALGDSTWSALKAKNDPAEVPSPGSVDDHFAKALGDTWLRIKAERESPRGPPPPFPVHTHHPLSHPIPHPHTLPHPLPQKSSSPSSQSNNTSLLST